MPDLISMEDVKYQLRMSDSEMAIKFGEMQRFIEQASAMILAHCNTTEHWRTETAAWVDEVTTPAVVKTAIAKQVAYLSQHRGDEPKGPQEDDGLAPGVKAMLRLYRDPVIA